MTVAIPKVRMVAENIELSGDRIEVRLREGGTLVDSDLRQERAATHPRSPSVDFYIKPIVENSPDNGKVVLREERFRRDAQRWGSVREKMAERLELQEIQVKFNFVNSFAQRVLGEFRRELESGRVAPSTQTASSVALSYTSPRGEAMTCVVSYTGGEDSEHPRRLISFSIEDTIGGPGSERISVNVRDPAILEPLRQNLERLIQ